MIAKRGRGRKAWLDAKVHKGKLVIEIGVETLAFSAQRRLDEQAFDASEGEKMDSNIRVVGPDAFAEEIVSALLKEAEDGSNRLHYLFDGAFDYAIDQGAEGLMENEENTAR